MLFESDSQHSASTYNGGRIIEEISKLNAHRIVFGLILREHCPRD